MGIKKYFPGGIRIIGLGTCFNPRRGNVDRYVYILVRNSL